MHQFQILPPGPHFLVLLISRTNFWSKKYFLYKTNVEDGQKVHWKSAPLITICIFSQNQNIFFDQKLVLEISVTKKGGPGGKIWEWYIILLYINFLNIWHLCWPWVRVDIEVQIYYWFCKYFGKFGVKSPWLYLWQYWKFLQLC